MSVFGYGYCVKRLLRTKDVIVEKMVDLRFRKDGYQGYVFYYVVN
ncbi:MAG: hypothetical protein ACD_47C00246G0002 [uncultured bacterium]|nr:MAG: hypothetical protein ACD_47C00246G0002 [uncultured bacterium]